MNLLCGCTVSDSVFAAWSRRLVFPQEPIYLTDETVSLLPKGTVRFTRQELRTLSLSLDYLDAYRTYYVKQEATWVAFLSPKELRALPRQTQAFIYEQQHRLRRAQLYDWAWVERVLSEDAAILRRFEHHTFTADGKLLFPLAYDLWWALTDLQRSRWLSAFVQDQSPNTCLSGSLGEKTWLQLTERLGPNVRFLAGTFAANSGPNCMATAMAALAPTLAQCASTANLWLTQQPFLRTISEHGYGEAALTEDLSRLPAGSVLTWLGSDRLPQHACFVLGDGLVLNKDSQSWWSPRQVLRIQQLVDRWADEGFELTLWCSKGQ